MTIQIAGSKTIEEWNALKPRLEGRLADEGAWIEAFSFLEDRLKYRYFDPIEAIRSSVDNSKLRGEGFAICTLVCSLIEAIETFHQGKTFSLNPINDFEYGPRCSSEIFTNFLTQREPFNQYFDPELARDFYKNVRCALLHEASTRNNWKINIHGHETVIREGDYKIINRSLLVSDLQNCLSAYKALLLGEDEGLKEAFVRKMDGVCRTAV